jgi:uncharacterized integral membrane protein
VKFSMILLIVLLALVAMFAIQNPGIVTVRFMSLSGDTSILVVIVAAFGVGVLGAGLASIPGQVRRRSEVTTAKQRTRELEGEVRNLKAEIETLQKGKEGQKPGGAA